MNPIQQFRDLVASAATAFSAASGAPEIVPHGAAIVALVRANQEDREAFEREFIASTAVAPPELIEFCMHALRWESLHAYFKGQQQAAIERNDWRAEPYFRGIVESFEPSWEDAKDFYASYFGRQSA